MSEERWIVKSAQYYFMCRLWTIAVSMMASSKGNIFRVAGLLCGKSPGTGDFPLQRPVMQSFDVFFDLYLNKRVNNRDTCDLKCNRAHYAVTVMKKSIWRRSLYLGHVTEDVWSVHGAISLKLLAGILTRLVTWSSSTHKLYFNKHCFPVVQSWCLHLLQH